MPLKLVLPLLSTIALLLVFVAFSSPYRQVAEGAHGGGTINTVALDASPDNAATTVDGVITPCVEVDAGGTVTLDLIVDSIPATDAASIYEAHVYYDDSRLSITANDISFLATSNGGNVNNFSDNTPDTGANGAQDPGRYIVSVVVTPPGAAFSGPGILARLSFTAAQGGTNAPPGLYPITLAASVEDLPNRNFDTQLFIQDLSGQIPIDPGGVEDASIAVGQACDDVSPQPTAPTSDTDTDGDGIPDDEDAFPLDAAEDTDTDADGQGDNADTDDDNDGISDSEEAVLGTDPLNPDSDGDGLSDGDEVAGGSDPLDDTSSTPSGGPATGVGSQAAVDDDDALPWVAIIVGVAIALVAGSTAAAVAYKRWWRPRARP